VQAIMAAFPGARLEAVRDPTADEYRLPRIAPTVDWAADPSAVEALSAAGPDLPDDMPDFAPPDAELTDEMELEDDL
jgi:DNA polymerase-3 subunit gamma/tau